MDTETLLYKSFNMLARALNIDTNLWLRHNWTMRKITELDAELTKMNIPSIARKILIKTASLSILATIGMIAPTEKAKADFRICNDTKSLVGAALGYRKDGVWISEGWFQVPAESCNALVEGDLSSRFYYLYAEDAERGGQWGGSIFLCTNDREFRIEGTADCFKRGHIKTGFFEIDTGNRASWMVRLTEQSQSSSGQ